jgi:hypothetical protein
MHHVQYVATHFFVEFVKTLFKLKTVNDLNVPKNVHVSLKALCKRPLPLINIKHLKLHSSLSSLTTFNIVGNVCGLN